MFSFHLLPSPTAPTCRLVISVAFCQLRFTVPRCLLFVLRPLSWNASSRWLLIYRKFDTDASPDTGPRPFKLLLRYWGNSKEAIVLLWKKLKLRFLSQVGEKFWIVTHKIKTIFNELKLEIFYLIYAVNNRIFSS